MNTKTEHQTEFDFMKSKQTTFNFDDYVYPLYSVGGLKLHQPTYSNIVFRNNDENVGALDWSDGTMKFKGEADESAQLFFNNIIKIYVQSKLPFAS